ncbi:hypothetical protein [Demequina soli]|uniref:hypothetical protein n=1 Tax=Demequina soli TaxID=1638987 RepID=UPI0007841555|nr:hypothetical protein [Demequina soli]
MRRVAAFVAGAAAAAAMGATLDWNLRECADVCGMAPESLTWFSVGVIALYASVPMALLTAVLVWTLGIRPAAPGEAAVRVALGESVAQGTARAALTGLRDGLAVATAAYLVTGAIHVALETTRGWAAFSTDTIYWAMRGIEGILVALCLATAHAIAVWRPRRTPVERLREDLAPYAPRRAGRGAVVLALVAAAAAAAVVGVALVAGVVPASPATATAGVAWTVAAVALVALALGVVVPAARRAVPHAVAAAAGLSDRLDAPRLSAVLAARAAAPTRSGGRAVMVLGALAFAVAAMSDAPTGLHQSERFVMTVTEPTDAAPGTAARLAAINGVAAVVTADARAGADAMHTVVRVDPATLAGLDDALADALLAHPGAVVAPTSTVADVTNGDLRPTGIVPLAGGDAAFIDAATTSGPPSELAHLIYAADGADKRAIIAAVGGAIDDAPGMGALYPDGWQRGAPDAVPGWILYRVAVLALLVAPLAAGAMRAGAREAATMAALGAEATVVRSALAVEGLALAAMACGAGIASGTATRAILEALGAAQASLDGVITDSYLGTALASVAWSDAITWGVTMVAVYGAVSALIAAGMHLETPAEALRDLAVAR